jgi:hypothetical protein
MVSGAGKNIPVLESPLGLIDGALVLPAATTIPVENVETPERTTPVSLNVTVPNPLRFVIEFTRISDAIMVF